MLPLEVTLVPTFLVVHKFEWINTYQGIVAPLLIDAFGVFLMRQSFRDIPDDLFEAAALDGAGPATIFRRIALPSVRPALATLALIQFIWSWSNYFWPLVAMQDPDKQVAQVAMAALQTSANYQPRYGEMFAAATVITVPLIVLAIVLQRAYVRGLAGPGAMCYVAPSFAAHKAPDAA